MGQNDIIIHYIGGGDMAQNIKVNLIIPDPENLSKLVSRAQAHFYASIIEDELPPELWGQAYDILLDKVKKEIEPDKQAI